MNQKPRNLSELRQFLFSGIDPTILGLYRVIFGCLMLVEISRLWQCLDPVYVAPSCNLPLDPFGWTSPGSRSLMQTELALMLGSCLMLIIGYRPRITVLPLLIGYFHFFFSEQTQYNNHYYLILLFQAFFLFIDSSAAISCDSWRAKTHRSIPFWNLGCCAVSSWCSTSLAAWRRSRQIGFAVSR